MMLGGEERHAQQRRQAPQAGVVAEQEGRYHDQSVTVPLAGAEMRDMVTIGNAFAKRTGRLAKNASILRFALAQLAKRMAAVPAERELVIQDFIASISEVTAARREHREQRRQQQMQELAAKGEN
jgi:hypothetical protein